MQLLGDTADVPTPERLVTARRRQGEQLGRTGVPVRILQRGEVALGRLGSLQRQVQDQVGVAVTAPGGLQRLVLDLVAGLGELLRDGPYQGGHRRRAAAAPEVRLSPFIKVSSRTTLSMCDLAAINRSVGTQPSRTSYVTGLAAALPPGQHRLADVVLRSDLDLGGVGDLRPHRLARLVRPDTPAARQRGDQCQPPTGHRVAAGSGLDRDRAARVVHLDAHRVGHGQHPYDDRLLTVQQRVGDQLGDGEQGVRTGRVSSQGLGSEPSGAGHSVRVVPQGELGRRRHGARRHGCPLCRQPGRAWRPSRGVVARSTAGSTSDDLGRRGQHRADVSAAATMRDSVTAGHVDAGR